MGTADAFTDRLSDYIDDEDLSPAERTRIEAHLEVCAGCRATLAELREVVRRAAALPDTPPDVNLWPGVHDRLGSTIGRRGLRPSPLRWRFTFTFPQLVAAGLALMLVSGGAVWIASLGGNRTDFEPALASQRDGGRPVSPPGADARPVVFADPQYDQAVADLEEALEAGRTRLDPETVRILEQNLAAIDRAIDQCRRALSADPFNTYLNAHLADARQRKLSVLRRATALAQHEG